ncbi:uncharacterized protein LOC134688543 isoform X2 [Mytilus trossulus]|uniref:uncharacterized protein LOC134688543 isoform X2 n=1 Tax=Mytilus trossulus TaxID=6551 RepID=UPI00300762D0
MSEFCENFSKLNCSDFSKSNLKSIVKSIQKCLQNGNISFNFGSTEEYHTEIYQEVSTRLRNFKNFETFGELCNDINRKRLPGTIENNCKNLLSIIMNEIETPCRQQHVLPKIRVWNTLIKIQSNQKACAAAVYQRYDEQVEKGYTKLLRQKQRTKQKQHNLMRNCETSFVRVSQKPDHAQHPDDMHIIKSLMSLTGYSLKKVVITSMPVQNNISLDNPSSRLLTFSDWPIRTHVWPQQLSNAGFYYTREGTTVRCATCGVNTVVDNWKRFEKPEVVHFKLNSNCEFVKGNFSYLQSDQLLKDVPKSPHSSLKGGDALEEHGAILSPYHETNERKENISKPERRCNNVASSSAGNSNFCASNTTVKGLKVNDSLIGDKNSSECNHLNENSQLMNNGTTHTDICSSSLASNHISNTSLNNGASGLSTTNVDTKTGSNTSMIMLNKDQLYVSGSSQDNYTQNLQNNTGLVSNSMSMMEAATSNPQTIWNTPFESTVRRNINSQSININSPASTNQLERLTPNGQAILSPVNGTEAPFNHVANRPTSLNSKLQLQFKRSAYNNSIDIDVTVSANQSEREQTIYEPEFAHPNFRRFQDRMESYYEWPITAKQPPKVLAESGCFYTGKTDIVRCFSCNLGLAEWAETDDPWIEHARHNPKCWFLRREKGQPFIDKIQGEWQKRYKPKNPAFDDVLSRLATFDGWRDDIEQTPEDLADAGFFSTGEDDIVRCHYCDGGLRNWESGDVPWEEHARWFPHCKYLIKMKGMQYIESIKEKYQRHEASVNTTNTTEEQDNNQLLATENARTVLRMGFTVNTVKSAINSLIRTRGHSNFSTEDLLEFILNPVESSQTSKRTSNEASGQATRPFPGERDPAKLKVINTELKNNLLCVICRKNERCMLFANCGHRVTCEQCCRSIDFCPHCDKRIKKTVKTYMS